MSKFKTIIYFCKWHFCYSIFLVGRRQLDFKVTLPHFCVVVEMDKIFISSRTLFEQLSRKRVPLIYTDDQFHWIRTFRHTSSNNRQNIKCNNCKHSTDRASSLWSSFLSFFFLILCEKKGEKKQTTKQQDRLDCLLNEKRFRSYGQTFNVTFIAQLNGCPFLGPCSLSLLAVRDSFL